MSIPIMEQVGKSEGPGVKRVSKRLAARRRRREERIDPEGAPRKNRYRGYTN